MSAAAVSPLKILIAGPLSKKVKSDKAIRSKGPIRITGNGADFFHMFSLFKTMKFVLSLLKLKF